MSWTAGVPANVAQNVTSRWPGLGEKWLTLVDAELAQICARYEAVPVDTFRARFAYVVVAAKDGKSLVMRGTPDVDGPAQARVSQALGNVDAGPVVHDVVVTKAGTWTVSDQVIPGTPLGALGFSPEMVDAVAESLRPMLAATISGPVMPLIADWLHARLIDDDLADIPPGYDIAPSEKRREALSILAGLRTSGEAGLCHGDASPWNILEGRDGRMLLIDPRGMAGEVAYDAAVVALKARRYGYSVDAVPALASRIGLDPERIRSWVCVADAARV